MPRNVLIGTFGGGSLAISFLDCFWEFQNILFDKIILVTTNYHGILQGYKELESHIKSNCPVCKSRYEKLEIYPDPIGMDDVVTENDHHAMLSLLLKNIHKETKSNSNVYLGLTGGRRSMNVIFAFAAMLLPVTGLYDAIVKNSSVTKKAEDQKRGWNEFDEETKKKIWESESNRWGLINQDLSQLPITLSYHFNVKEDYNLVQLPFVGLTPFLEAFIKQLKQPSSDDSAQDDWTTRGVDIIRQNQDVVDVIQGLQDLFETPIEEVITPILLWLEMNDEDFWHDCIKWGTNNHRCGLSNLRGTWEYHKSMLIAKKIGDPLFRKFDNLFMTDKSLYEVKSQFYDYCLEFNEKIINTIQKRSKPLKGWLSDIKEIVYRETKSSLKLTFGKEINSKLTVCTSPDLDHSISEIMRNALQHGKSRSEICFIKNGVVINNDGNFDSVKWRNSPKKQTIDIVMEDHQLNFDIKSIDGKVCATISWNNKIGDIMPVNVMKIRKGGYYAKNING